MNTTITDLIRQTMYIERAEQVSSHQKLIKNRTVLFSLTERCKTFPTKSAGCLTQILSTRDDTGLVCNGV